MYSNYSQIPVNNIPSYNDLQDSRISSSMPVSFSSSSISNPYMSSSSDRIIGGGFLGPFVLGGITGGLLAPAFYPRPYPRPFYPRPFPPRPYPYYGPYYR